MFMCVNVHLCMHIRASHVYMLMCACVHVCVGGHASVCACISGCARVLAVETTAVAKARLPWGPSVAILAQPPQAPQECATGSSALTGRAGESRPTPGPPAVPLAAVLTPALLSADNPNPAPPSAQDNPG